MLQKCCEIPQMASPETPHPRSIQILRPRSPPWPGRHGAPVRGYQRYQRYPTGLWWKSINICNIYIYMCVYICTVYIYKYVCKFIHIYICQSYLIYIYYTYMIFRDDVSYRFTYWTMEPSKWASAQIWEFFKIGESVLLVLGLCLVRVLPTAGETTFNTFRSPVRVMTSHIDGGRNAFSWFPQKT
jgi:hypothetical protein